MRQQGVTRVHLLAPAYYWIGLKANVQTCTPCGLQWLARTEIQQRATNKSAMGARIQ